LATPRWPRWCGAPGAASSPVRSAPASPAWPCWTPRYPPARRFRAPWCTPPLRGAGWVAVNGCCDSATGHRGGIIPIDGGLRAVERFAIDFVQLGPDCRLFVGPVENLSSFRYQGADVHSVADGTVVRTHDGEPEQTPPNGPAGFPTPQNAGGNWLMVAIGGGHFAFYAHLQPHSITAKVGDRVRRGQVRGLLGNTGTPPDRICTSTSWTARRSTPTACRSSSMRSPVPSRSPGRSSAATPARRRRSAEGP
jgi:hypothetical protein